MTEKTIWIYLEPNVDVEDSRRWVLNFKKKGLRGNIPIVLFKGNIKKSWIRCSFGDDYNVSEQALDDTAKHFGVHNVRITERVPKCNKKSPVRKTLTRRPIIGGKTFKDP